MKVNAKAVFADGADKKVKYGKDAFTELKLSKAADKLLGELDEKKETGDQSAGVARKPKAKLSELSDTDLKRVIYKAACAPGYLDENGELPEDMVVNISPARRSEAFGMLRDVFEDRELEPSEDRPQLEGVIRDILPLLLGSSNSRVYGVEMPDTGYGALAGVAVVDTQKNEIRVVENMVIP